LAGRLLTTGTLRITPPFGKTIWLTLTFLFLLGGAVELVARSELFQAPLTPPKMGSSHYQLGHKLALLEAEIKRNGSVDCIMVGSSMVDVGFDPDSFRSGFQEVGGRDIHCFNFGIDASSVASVSAIVRILIDDYHPNLLIFGTDPRDYVLPDDDPDVATILDTPWVRYRLGIFSLDGWLIDQSYFYRYRQHLSRLSRLNFSDTLWSETKLNFEILNNGFTPISKVNTHVNAPPDPQDDSYEVTYYTRILSSYHMLAENLASLEEIMDHNKSDTQIVVVEMPVSDGYYYFFGNGENDYKRFVDQVSKLSKLNQVPFWRTEPLNMIPDDGWSDYSHLNTKGAEIFSIWLGQQVGKAKTQR
jgi:hypothetical protein